MICPSLEKHVAAELVKEAAAAKERRKLREEWKGTGKGAQKDK